MGDIFRKYFPHLEETKLPHQPGINGLTYFYDFSVEEANAMVNDPSWTRVIFLRDPLARFLSAYLDKIVRHPRTKGVQGWTFATFISEVEAGYRDVHWNPQCELVDCQKWLPVMDFVGSFSDLSTDTELLLRKIGAWEQYGSNGWGVHKNTTIFAGAKNTVHATGADSKLKTYYNDADIKRRVKAIMAPDLDLYVDTILE